MECNARADNEVGDDGATELARALQKNTTFTDVSLIGPYITCCCCLATPTHCFVHHARRLSKVRAPLLPDTEIEQDGATELARSLANNMAVTTITLTRMWPRSMQQHVISDFRKSLSPAGAGNSIGAPGATALAAALRTNATITDVTISGAQAVWVTILQRCTVC
jgi:hypothetical protein